MPTCSSVWCNTIFSGLRSLCIILFPWRYSTAEAMSRTRHRMSYCFRPTQFSGLLSTWKDTTTEISKFLASTVAFNSMWITLCLEMFITSHLDNAENSCIYQFTKNTLLAIHLLMWQIQIFCWIKISLFLTLSPWEIIAERHEGSFKQIIWNLNFCIFF